MIRYLCACCSRKRSQKYLYLIYFHFTHHTIRICVDCWAKHPNPISIEESAAVDKGKL